MGNVVIKDFEVLPRENDERKTNSEKSDGNGKNSDKSQPKPESLIKVLQKQSERISRVSAR